ncbi:carboxypeptidase regulatory-like domain-containing protein [Corallococcus sp. AB004]|uniref:carboxypeptidase-like regulatory domain-containing protein n=1 Tax=Corallococcus exiguus TaxID=83462 RepID=UPI000EA222DE|nr:carboxypeptidase-like regulatory domain-containing protein [Corallococcus exiguus]NPD25359.1 carboxypeptidase regulatory-like domain-containing protein [Corallococcus exiguus]RKI44462.1 carboxypeptidase regulatory-like domain-containing protein [Corallococcus sp. AB004]
MKKQVLMAVLPLMVWGCGDPTDADNDGVADGIRDPNNVSVVVPSTPKGTVSGQVLSTTLQPIADVAVAMTIGSQPTGKSVTTDASGNFVMTDVPAGAQVLLTFSKSGFSTLRATSTVPSSAGNVPINNGNASFGPVTLTQLNGSLAVTVVTPQGRPAVGAKAVLEVDKAGSVILSNYDSVSSVVSKVYVEATADANGILTFNGIPSGIELARLNGTYNLWIAPMDTNGDGVVDTGGYTKSYSGGSIVGSQATTLAQLNFSKPSGVGALNIEGGNVSSLKGAAETDPLRNLVRPGEPIYVYFNQPVQPGSVFVRLTDEYAKESLPVTASVNVGGYSATITPGNGIVQEGKEYNIFVRAVAAEGGSNYSRTGFFFGGDQSAPRAITIAEIRYQEQERPPANGAFQLNTGELVYVTFSAPIAKQVGQSVQVFFGTDIDGVGGVGGNSIGEIDNYSGQGFPLDIAEPTKPIQTRTPAELPVFGIQASGYSTRYSFTYGGTTALSGGLDRIRIRVAFSNLAPVLGTNDVYESIWGQPINADLEATGIIQQPAPALPN